jgi:hypothetical protein
VTDGGRANGGEVKLKRNGTERVAADKKGVGAKRGAKEGGEKKRGKERRRFLLRASPLPPPLFPADPS